MSPTFKAATYNAYFKVKPAQVVKHMTRLKSKGVSVVLLQEVNTAKVQALQADGWHVVKHSQASNAVAWDPDIWEKRDSKMVTLADPYQRGTPKGLVHTASPFVWLQHKPSGRSLWALSYHLPSRVQRKNASAVRIEVHKQAARKLDSLAAGTYTSLFGGDDNVDERTGKWPWLTTQMKNLKQIVATRGTHGNRKIDDFRIRGLKAGAGEVISSESDHKTHIREFTILPLPKPKKRPGAIDLAIAYAQRKKLPERVRLLKQAQRTWH